MTDPTHDAMVSRIAALESALRDAHHQLATRNGWWVTDKPEFWSGEEIEIEGTTYHATTGVTLRANEGTYHRDDTTEACKRIEAALSGS